MLSRPQLLVFAGSALLAAALAPRLAAQATTAADAAESPAIAVGTAITYQGLLTQAGSPASGVWDFEFLLFDASGGGAQIGSTVTVGDLAVSAGVFTASLDFGVAAFGGGARWLEIHVRPGASGGAYTPLSPRAPLTAAPIALSLPGVYVDETNRFVGVGRSFRVSGNEVFGVRAVAGAGVYGGMFVDTTDPGGWPFYGYSTNGSYRAWTWYDGTTGDWSLYNDGTRLRVPSTGGLRIGPATNYSLVIENTLGSDGIRVLDTGDDAIQIGSNPDIPNYGVYIPSPGVSTYGLWSNTSAASGEWALYSVDYVQAGNVFAAGMTQIARVGGEAPLEAGDLVAASGFANGLAGAQDLLPLVVPAGQPERLGAIGVVRSRMGLVPKPGKEGADAFALESLPGPAKPGDFVALTVRGVTLVRCESDETIAPGQRLTVGERAGAVRPLQTRSLDGMEVSEGTPIVGVAVGTIDEETGLVPVYVMLP